MAESRKHTFADSGLSLTEEDIVIEPTFKAPTLIKSGRDLMNVCGDATSISKKHLPNDCLYLVTHLKTVDVRGTDQAVYMTAKAIMQSIRSDVDEEEELTQPEVVQPPAVYSITTENFEDVHGESINDIIQCTAPKKLAKAWLSGAITTAHLDDGLCFMVNESYDREHPANLFMGNVRLSYQFYTSQDLTKEVMANIQDGDVASEPLSEFFHTCLQVSKQYLKRNEKHCAGFTRYNPAKVAGGKKNRVDAVARKLFR